MKNVFKGALILFLGAFFINSSQLLADSSKKLSDNPEYKIGAKIPNISFVDLKNKKFELSQFRGNHIFLNFWATWCPPCVEEIPSLNALNDIFRAGPFLVIAVSVDDKPSLVETFLKQLKGGPPSFKTFIDPNKELAQKFGVDKFPETIWIGPDGAYKKKFVGAQNWTHSSLISEIDSAISKKTE